MPNGRWMHKKIEISFWAQKLFGLRRTKGITQAEMAKAMNISTEQLRAIEIGMRPLSIPEAQSAAAKLGIELWEFFAVSSQKEPVSQVERKLISQYRFLNENQRKLVFDIAFEFAQLNPSKKSSDP